MSGTCGGGDPLSRAVLLFDLDGTLVDSAPAIAAALTIQRRRRGGGPIGADVVRRLVSLGAPILVRRALGALADDAAGDLAEFRHILGGLPADASVCCPGVPGALEALAAAGRAMAIVTNKPEALSRSLLAGLGLARHFGAVVGGDTLARCKPDPAPALHALAALGGGDALFIGDSAIDAETARRAGMPFLLYERGYDAGSCRPEHVAARFADFAALPGLIASPPYRSLAS